VYEKATGKAGTNRETPDPFQAARLYGPVFDIVSELRHFRHFVSASGDKPEYFRSGQRSFEERIYPAMSGMPVFTLTSCRVNDRSPAPKGLADAFLRSKATIKTIIRQNLLTKMKAIILELNNEPGLDANPLSTSVSFQKFIDFVKETAGTETSLRGTYLQKAVEALTGEPGFSKAKAVEEIVRFTPELKIVYDLLLPALQLHENTLWAMGMPMSSLIFYGTDRFYEMVMSSKTSKLKSELITDEKVSLTDNDKIHTVYALILQRLYGITTPDDRHIVISIQETKTSLPQYFRVNIDHRFTEVYPNFELPELNPEIVQEMLTGKGDMEKLMRLLPLAHFRFEGISIITLTDITTEYTLEHIKNIMLERHQFDQNTFYTHITDSLKILTAEPGLDFGLIPQLSLNDKLIFDRETIFHSKHVPIDMPDDYASDIYRSYANYFIRNQGIKFMSGFEIDRQLNAFSEIIKKGGIKSFAVMPVYNGLQLVGLLEIYSTEEVVLTEKIIAKVRQAEQLVSRIFQNTIDEFNANIESVIKDQFTSVQHAVQWKFKEAAWHFLRDKIIHEEAEIEKITFKDVYPLYGAIDIKNSTTARNEALSGDLCLQMERLIGIVSRLSQKFGLLLANEMEFKCRKILNAVSGEPKPLDEMKIIEFLDDEAHPFLQHFLDDFREDESVTSYQRVKKQIPETEALRLAILDYFAGTDPDTGRFFAERRSLERSMHTINTSVNSALDNFKYQVQELYPVYFEKFRTDGVEYDIYLGQSIEPDRRFSSIYLKNVKLWQLKSMASIARMTHALISGMEKSLQTTQLIFVNSGTIDISFREDERRFDVEGAYNIRYQVIKKRIDKVHIKGTGERLTQPGKIALVYFQNKSLADYLDYIRFLQSEHILSDNLEFLELEELQGVSGLKALRVEVILDDLP
jgi:hypothetical protein